MSRSSNELLNARPSTLYHRGRAGLRGRSGARFGPCPKHARGIHRPATTPRVRTCEGRSRRPRRTAPFVPRVSQPQGNQGSVGSPVVRQRARPIRQTSSVCTPTSARGQGLFDTVSFGPARSSVRIDQRWSWYPKAGARGYGGCLSNGLASRRSDGQISEDWNCVAGRGR